MTQRNRPSGTRGMWETGVTERENEQRTRNDEQCNGERLTTGGVQPRTRQRVKKKKGSGGTESRETSGNVGGSREV